MEKISSGLTHCAKRSSVVRPELKLGIVERQMGYRMMRDNRSRRRREDSRTRIPSHTWITLNLKGVVSG